MAVKLSLQVRAIQLRRRSEDCCIRVVLMGCPVITAEKCFDVGLQRHVHLDLGSYLTVHLSEIKVPMST